MKQPVMPNQTAAMRCQARKTADLFLQREDRRGVVELPNE